MLVATLQIIRRLRIFRVEISFAFVVKDEAILAATVAAVITDLAAWMAAVTMAATSTGPDK